MDICSSPQLFAAYHVLHRLLVPRHPPCALSCLTFPVVIAFKTGGSLAVSFHRVYNVMSSYCFDSLSLKDNSSDVSFPISKRLTFFLDYFVYAVFKVHVRSAHMKIAQPSAGAWPTRDLLRRHLAGCSPRNVFFILLKIYGL